MKWIPVWICVAVIVVVTVGDSSIKKSRCGQFQAEQHARRIAATTFANLASANLLFVPIARGAVAATCNGAYAKQVLESRSFEGVSAETFLWIDCDHAGLDRTREYSFANDRWVPVMPDPHFEHIHLALWTGMRRSPFAMIVARALVEEACAKSNVRVEIHPGLYDDESLERANFVGCGAVYIDPQYIPSQVYSFECGAWVDANARSCRFDA